MDPRPTAGEHESTAVTVPPTRRTPWLRLGLGLGALASAAILFAAVDSWRLRTARAQGLRAFHERRFAEARPLLEWVSSRRPDDGEVAYDLGLSELALGHSDAAQAAWARVPRSSAFAGRAAVLRARALLNRDQLSAGEDLMTIAVRERGPHALDARETLIYLCKLQGRFDEARRLVHEGWADHPDPVGMIQEAWRLEGAVPIAIEENQRVLENASRNAPDDDRVWLMRASLATRTGQLAEAKRWLDACRQRRPDDPAVRRAWLTWALESNNPTEARLALAHFPDDRLEPRDLLRLRAWFAERAGDRQREHRALTELLAVDPSNFAALERLAGLSRELGREDEAAQLRARKTELDRAWTAYVKRLFEPGQRADVVTLARAAEAVGRWFEARAFWALAARDDPHNAEARTALARLERAERERPSGPTRDRLLAEIAPRASAPSIALHKPDAGHAEFTDDAEAVGLRFTYENGRSAERQIPETMGGGIGLIDYDGDGWLDVYVTQGGPFPPDPKRPTSGDRLFRNRGDGTFEDATKAAGIAELAQGYGHGVAVGDYDGDGLPDLLVTRWRSYALYRNRGDGTFDDATRASGLDGDRDWPSCAAFADLDGDGDLDLYVSHYAVWDAEHPMTCYDEKLQANRLCHPSKCAPIADHVFRNDNGRFVDVSREAGVIDNDGRGMGVVAADLDGDRRIDVYVANDMSANFLFHNRGEFRFEEVGHEWGVAAGANGGYQASMGVACGDLSGDGLPDLAVTNFQKESTTYYQNLGGGVFTDRTEEIGLAVPSRFLLGFGAVFFDFNSDGRLDLATANGHIDDFRPDAPYQMPAQLLAGGEGGHLTEVTAQAGPPWQVPRIGRALAVGDLDNDGRADLLLLSHDTPLAYFHNRTPGGHAVSFLLEGRASNRDGVGAVVTLTSGGRRQTLQRIGGGSYQSASDARLHAGLGPSDRVESVEVTWPSGRVDCYRDLAADAEYLLIEGRNEPVRLAGPSRR